MSGRRGADARGESGRAPPPRAQLPLLDRLMDDSPDREIDPPLSPAEALAVLRRSVRRDLEALLNTRRHWRSLPPTMEALRVSPLGYGIPDFTAGTYNDPRAREQLREEIEATIRRFEPRFLTISVTLPETRDRLDATLRLRIDALLHADPAPEPVAFDTLLEPTTAEVVVRMRDDG
jgi:type VI secretion system protein ImpF